MQKQDLIPTALTPTASSRRPIAIVQPAPPSKFRFLIITLFIARFLLRNLAASLWPRWRKRRFSPAQQAQFLRSFMEKMGGLWVKAGQIVALRRDLFSEDFCEELARLQDRASGFPGAQARRLIESELGMPLDEVFTEFDEQPLAAASIGQVHRARLRDSGREVVIKVRRPNIAASLDADLGYLRKLVWFLTTLELAPYVRWMDMYFEISNAVLEELDYQLEAASLRRMRKKLRHHQVYVPKVYFDLSTSRVLVMEKVEGVYMAEFIQVLASDPERAQTWLKENQICAQQTGKLLLFSHWRQLFEDNLYHCDLHPGNILLMRRNRVTLIDFGSVGTMDKTLLVKYLHLFISVAKCDYQKAADMFFLIAPSLPSTDLGAVKQQVVRLYREFEPLTKIKTLPYHQKSAGRVAGAITQTLGRAKITFPWDVLRTMRSDLTLDAALMALTPAINYPKVIREYLQKMRKRQQREMRSPRLARAYLAKASQMLDMPAKLAENAYFEGEYLRRRALQYEGYLSKASRVGASVVSWLARLVALSSLVPISACAHQRWNTLRSLHGSFVYSELDRLPVLETYVWVLFTFLAFYVTRELAGISRIMAQAAPFRAGGSRS